MRGFGAIFYKEMLQLRRDPITLVIMFLIPIIQLTIFGYAIDMDVKDFATAVYDLDQRRESRELLARFEGSQFFKIVEYVNSDEALSRAMVSGRVKIGIKIPPDYSNRLQRRQQATALVLIDGSDSTVAMRALNVAQALGLRESLLRKGVEMGSSNTPVDIRPRVLFNQDLKSANFMVPGLVGIIMQVVTVFLTAFALVREKERGTMEQLLVSPVSRGGLVLGKLIPYAIIGFLETLCVLTIMRWVFSVPVHGSLLLLLALAVIFLLCSLTIGILISTIAANQNQAMQMAFLVMMPSILLSGFMFPRETMPLGIYLLTFFIPVTYFLEVLRGIVIRGATIFELWDEALILCVFWGVLLLLSIKRFQKNLS